MSTAYGPPWGGIQGTGVTSSGVDLRAHPKQYVVAVDPNVVPIGTKLKIADNPFGDPNIVFTAADTGGAIKGNRLDFYDWRGRPAQMKWGTRSIVAELLGQGDPKHPAGPGGGQGQGGTQYLPGAPTSDLAGSQTGADLSTLIQTLMAPQQPMRPFGALPDPSFSARSALPLPAAYKPLQSSAMPAPHQDLGATMASLLPLLQGGSMPADAKPTTIVSPGGQGAGGGVRGVRLGRAIGGSPVPGEKPHAPTHPTAGLNGFPAFDYMAPAGSPVVAPVSGKIVRFSGYDPKLGAVQGAGGPLGWSIYLQGDNGHTYFLTHLGSRTVKVGQRVNQGVQIGTVANYRKYGRPDHVHMGVH